MIEPAEILVQPDVGAGERVALGAEQAAIAAGLGVIAAGACIAQRLGMTNGLDAPYEQIAESMAHPALGYAGALAGGVFARLAGYKKDLVAGAMAASAVNFGAEAVQALTVQTPGEGQFWAARQMPETAKDYVFALAGLALYYLHRKYRRPL